MKLFAPLLLLPLQLSLQSHELFDVSSIVKNNIEKAPGRDIKTQVIPGRLEFELYNQGGEGISYHDSDTINNGSGKLNPANGEFLNEFRKNEGVDISYTKPKGVDENPYNKVDPEMGKLYVGWTVPGEWIDYSVDVKKTGSYQLDLMYTANGDAAIGIDVDGKSALPRVSIKSTHDDNDSIAWRQWHHWNKIESIASLSLTKGFHKLRVRIIENGNINLDYLDFKRKENLNRKTIVFQSATNDKFQQVPISVI